jgi:hypothetical protein
VTSTATTVPRQRSTAARAMSTDHTTRRLLWLGVIAGPFCTAVWVALAAFRDGFDLRRHPVSLLANGDFGWVLALDFAFTGALVIGAAIGLRRALATGRGAIWAPRLVGLFGASFIVAAIFRADPSDGFPIGTAPGQPTTLSWHANIHYLAGTVGFVALVAAAFILARRFRAIAETPRAMATRAIAALFLAANVTVAAFGSDHDVAWVLTSAIIVVWAWLSTVAAHLARRAPFRSTP